MVKPNATDRLANVVPWTWAAAIWAKSELLKKTVVFSETLAGITATVACVAVGKKARVLSMNAAASNVSTVPAATITRYKTG